MTAALLCVTLGPLQGAASQAASRVPPAFSLHTQPSPTLPAGVSQSWFSQVTDNVRQSEYHFSSTAGGFSAPNRAQNLRATATASGVTVTSRTAADAWQATLRLMAWGRPNALAPIQPVTPIATANRLEYRYAALTAWYVNREHGLEQGFTLPAPPPRYPQNVSDTFSSVMLELAYAETLTAQLSPDGQTLTFADAAGRRVLNYGGLHVTDATGRALPAHLALTANHCFQLVIDDAGAQYPVTVDPILTTPVWRVEGSDLGVTSIGRFRQSIAPAGDVNGDGFSDFLMIADRIVMLFLGTATGPATTPSWTFDASKDITWPRPQAVASAGDVNGDGYDDVIVGAMGDSGDGNGQADDAVFVWLGGDMTTGCNGAPPSGLGDCGTPDNADWRAVHSGVNYGGASPELGYSVASAGDVNGDGYDDIVVSAPRLDTGHPPEPLQRGGATFVWLGGDFSIGCNGAPPSGLGPCGQANPDQPSFNPDWWAESNYDTPWGAGFGVAQTAGDVNGDGFSDLIVTMNPSELPKKAFVWLGGDGNGVCAPATAPSGLGVCGTPQNADWSAAEWTDPPGGDAGVSAMTAGDVNGDGYGDIMIGHYDHRNPEAKEGGTFVWLGGDVTTGCNGAPPSGLGDCGTPANADWSAESNRAWSFFGWSVGPAGDINGDGFSDIMADLPHNANKYYDRSALLWLGGPSGVGNASGLGPNGTPQNADWMAPIISQIGPTLYVGNFGPVITAGDVNGDGFNDVLVSAGHFSNPEVDESAVFLYYGAADGLTAQPVWTATTDQAATLHGYAVAAGDINGDGYEDALVGAPWYDSGEQNEGRAYCFLGSPQGLTVTASWQAESNAPLAQFGLSVAHVGDVNGDGFGDVLVGALGQNSAFLWLGSATGLGPNGTPANADWRAVDNQPNADFGGRVARAGDVNGDGFGDVLISAPFYDNPEDGEGAAFLWLGSATGLGPNGTPANADWRAESNQVRAHLTAISSAGDVNRDGFSDILVGAHEYDNGEVDEGAAWLYLGSANGLGPNGTPANADWRAEGNQLYAWFGEKTTSAGDVNGDGFSDVLISALYYDAGEADEGAAFLWQGGAAGLGPNGTPANATWSAQSNQAASFFGYALASAGDVNDDGFSDVAIGAPYYETGTAPNAGATFVWHGSTTGLGVPGTPANATWTASGPTTEAGAGWALAAGDVNGDGFSDLLVGVPFYQVAGQGGGANAHVALFYGNLGDGLDRTPRQLRVNAVAPQIPIHLLGKSDQWNGVRLAALGRTPLGRGRVKLQWEVKPLSQPFNFLGMQQQAAWTDTGAPGALPGVEGSGVPLQDVAAGLSANTPYHWRLRIKSTSPFFPWSPWLTIQPTSRTEEKFRTP